jgi:long-subunit acyl-CoA synthetase (AMP-forming)
MLNEEIGILVCDDTPIPAISTLPCLLLDSARQHRKPDAFKFKRNGQWISVSTDEFLLRVEELFFALRSLGLRPRDRAVILSENRLEWAIADYAVLCAGATTVPIYPTFTAPQIEALLKHCEPAIIFVSTAELLEKVLAARSGVAACQIVVFEPNIRVPEVTRLDALYEMGRVSALRPGRWDRRRRHHYLYVWYKWRPQRRHADAPKPCFQHCGYSRTATTAPR